MYYLEIIRTSAIGTILLVIYILSLIIPVSIGIYLFLNFISAPKRHKKTAINKVPETFFAIVIPAKDEESIIRHTIEKLKELQYPAALYDVLVIADNCSDNTANLASLSGADVYVRNDPEKQSKAHALKWLFDHERFIGKKYDAICILDADTILAPDFLNVMDQEISNGYEVVQGRCSAANPYESASASFMTVLASVENRLWYLPQANRNRSGFFNGTGACITLERIKKTGWNISTLVEDAEFSIQTVLKGGFVRYCDNARYYIELVTSYDQLWKQQRRWRTGQIDCLKKYIRPLMHSVFAKRNKDAISLLILVLIPVNCILFIFQTIMTPILFGEFFGYGNFNPGLIIAGFVANTIVMFSIYSFILWLDDLFSIRLWKGILAVIFSPYFYGIIDIATLFKPNKEWNIIKHGMPRRFMNKDMHGFSRAEKRKAARIIKEAKEEQ
ncbi:MAG: glycosyltransferase family 2 protein [Saccharofermentanales bacterium]